MLRYALALFALALAAPTAALADDALGSSGIVTELEVNTTAADTYLQYRGRMVVRGAGKVSTEYRWGGTSCGTRTLSEGQTALLQRALDGGLRVVPRYQLGQGQSLCVVGFRMAP